MSKITLNNLVNLTNQTTAVNTINVNNATLQNAFDNTLSRDGTSPNQMASTLDMNSNHIINLPSPVTQDEPIRLADMTNYTQFQNSVNLAAALASASASATTATNAATTATTAAATFSIPSTSIYQYIPSNQIPAIQAGTSTYDCGPAFNTALAALNGKPLYVPQGIYPIYTQIWYAGVINANVNISMVPGCKIIGEGSYRSILSNHVSGTLIQNAFSVTISTTLITAIIPSHGLLINQPVTFAGTGTTVGGLDIDGVWRVAAVIDANTIQFYHYNTATSTQTNVGTARVMKPMFNCAFYNTVNPTRTPFQLGTTFQGIGFISAIGSNNGTCGLRMNGQLQAKLDDVWFLGGDDGLEVYAVTGDSPPGGSVIIDSSTHILMERVRFDNNGRWGAEIVGSSENVPGTGLVGHNEISNVVMEDVLFNSCGLNVTSGLYGGGLKWKGQGVHFTSTDFVTCNNVGLYVAMPSGATATPNALSFDFLVFENCKGVASMYIDALDTMTGSVLEIYDNASYPASYGIYFNASSHSAIDNVNITSSIVRIDPAVTPYTLYLYNTSGANTVRIYTPSFQQFGAGGQTQATNITFRT